MFFYVVAECAVSQSLIFVNDIWIMLASLQNLSERFELKSVVQLFMSVDEGCQGDSLWLLNLPPSPLKISILLVWIKQTRQTEQDN